MYAFRHIDVKIFIPRKIGEGAKFLYRFFFHLLYEFVLSVAVAFEVGGKPNGEGFFQGAVFVRLVFMTAEIIAHSQMPRNVRLVRFFEKMEMMRRFSLPLRKYPPARDAEFSHTFVTERSKAAFCSSALRYPLLTGRSL